MYTPKHFRIEELEDIKAFMQQYSFATVVSNVDGIPYASHLPLLVKEKDGVLYVRGHFAKANRHWQAIEQQKVLVMFNGPHAFIPNAWYEEHNTVSTWNYMAVHAIGEARLIDDKAEFEALLHETEHFYQQLYTQTVPQQNDAHYIDMMMKGIVGFELQIEQLDAKWKLSQNHSAARREKVITQLHQQSDTQSQQLASYMERVKSE